MTNNTNEKTTTYTGDDKKTLQEWRTTISARGEILKNEIERARQRSRLSKESLEKFWDFSERAKCAVAEEQSDNFLKLAQPIINDKSTVRELTDIAFSVAELDIGLAVQGLRNEMGASAHYLSLQEQGGRVGVPSVFRDVGADMKALLQGLMTKGAGTIAPAFSAAPSVLLGLNARSEGFGIEALMPGCAGPDSSYIGVELKTAVGPVWAQWLPEQKQYLITFNRKLIVDAPWKTGGKPNEVVVTDVSDLDEITVKKKS